MKRIMIIGPNVGLGGVERASANIANSITTKGVEVIYLALIPEVKFYPLDSKIYYIEPTGFNTKKISFLKSLLFIRRNVILNNPDKILVFAKFYGALANLALFGTKYRIVLSERSSPFYIWPFHINFFSKLSFDLKKPLGLITQTSIAKSVFSEKYKNTRIQVIPNAVKIVKLFPEIHRKNIILAVGRFGDSCKGFDLLAKAYNEIHNLGWELHFAGGDEKDADFMNLVSNEARRKIVFLGKVEEIDIVYAKVGIFVIPSRSEGFPNALCEAMAAGLPCISFDFIAGPRDIITDGEDGILVENGNVEQLALEIKKLINNPLKREILGKNALKIRERFDADKIGKEYLDFLYEK